MAVQRLLCSSPSSHWSLVHGPIVFTLWAGSSLHILPPLVHPHGHVNTRTEASSHAKQSQSPQTDSHTNTHRCKHNIKTRAWGQVLSGHVQTQGFILTPTPACSWHISAGKQTNKYQDHKSGKCTLSRLSEVKIFSRKTTPVADILYSI